MSASIFIVDDNEDAADLLGEVLRRLGYQVHVLHAPHEALELIEHVTPDAALLDIGLPELDGYALAAELHRIRPTLPLIAPTGYGLSHDRARALAAGFADHLVKPVTVPQLINALGRVLGNAPSRE